MRSLSSKLLPHPTLVLILVVTIQLILIWYLAVIGIWQGDVVGQFEEWGFATTVSYYQLLFLAVLSLAIFLLRYRQTGRFRLALIWGLATIGFVLLAQDERYEWHENFDYFIHEYFGFEETAVTDRLDDAIIGLYGLIALFCLYLYRQELTRFSRFNKLIVSGFVLLFVTVALDILTNREDILLALVDDRKLAMILYDSFELAEEAGKLLMEGILIAAFYAFFYDSCREPTAHQVS